MNLSNNEIHRIAGFVTADPALTTVASIATTKHECLELLTLAINKVVDAYGDPSGMWRNVPAFMRPAVAGMVAVQLLPHVDKFPITFQRVIRTAARAV